MVAYITSIKVARVVKLKSPFMEWFFYNLVMLIKLYKIWYLNLDNADHLDKYPGRETRLFVWKIGNFDEVQLPQSLIFFAEILHTFLT